MSDNDKPILLVVCKDYGELAYALYFLEGQSFARNTTLMLPPRLYDQNPDVLPGRTSVYHSIDDIAEKLQSQTPGILGFFSGYLLPIHGLCTPEALDSLLRSSHAKGWKSFTTDPFLGLLDEVETSKLFVLKSPKKWSIIFAVGAAIGRKLATRTLVKMRPVLRETLHVYPFGKSETTTDANICRRAHFHNNAYFEQHGPSVSAPTVDLDSERWLFVMGDEDYKLQEGKYGRMFKLILIRKLHDTLEAGRRPTLIAPVKVIESVEKHSPVAHAMELLAHCGYSQFQALLIDAEYVFYWNAASFSSLLRTLAGKPWFTFDEGHLLRGLNAAYANRIFDWFYYGEKPPYLDIGNTLTCEALQEAKQQYDTTAQRTQQGLLDSPNPEALLSALDRQHSTALESDNFHCNPAQ